MLTNSIPTLAFDPTWVVLKVQGGELSNRKLLKIKSWVRIGIGALVLYLGVTTYSSNNAVGFLVGLLGAVLALDGLGLLEK